MVGDQGLYVLVWVLVSELARSEAPFRQRPLRAREFDKYKRLATAIATGTLDAHAPAQGHPTSYWYHQTTMNNLTS